MKKKDTSVYEQLQQYAESRAYPFHMPGHKRKIDWIQNPYEVDITEIDGFDDLHHAQGVLKDGMDRLAEAVGALKSYYIVNGSTCGILAALYGGCPEGGRIAAARNTHKSVAHGMIIRRLRPVYIYPQNVDNLWITGKVMHTDIERIYERYPDLCAVVLTSPTYEGIVSEIKQIARVVHAHGGILIVDEAHGAHLPYAEKGTLPPSAVSQGADIVIQSLHKTLPCLTQSAALHICSSRVDRKKIERALQIFETSSPSYVLMAGMDCCVRYMQKEGKERLKALCSRLKLFYQKAEKWDELWFLHLELCRQRDLGITADNSWDYTKILFGARNYPGTAKRLHALLVERYQLQPEMSTPDYVLLMTMVTDTEEGFFRLEQALEELNAELRAGTLFGNTEKEKRSVPVFPRPEQAMRPCEAVEADVCSVPVEQALGRISAETVYIYPPGCPFLMPGERIDEQLISLMRHYQECGMELYGMEDETGKQILVTGLAEDKGERG